MKLIEVRCGDDPHIKTAVRAAKIQAKKSSGKYKLGAVIFKGKKIISFGFNKIKTHPSFGSKNYKNIHAEGSALYYAYHRGIKVNGFSLLVYRKNHTLSKPCPDCLKLIESAGIKKVYYTIT